MEFYGLTCDNTIMKLSGKEAAEAKKRGEAYENDLAIEGIFLDAADREIIDTIEREGMGYDEGVRYATQRLRRRVLDKPVGSGSLATMECKAMAARQ